MKAMILAAGRGERMRPLTDNCPKPLLQVGGKALILWHIERLRDAGFSDLVINHAHLGEQIEAALGKGWRYGVNIRYSPEATALETAGGIRKALPLLGDAPFLVVNGDVFCDADFAALRAAGESLKANHDLAHLLLVANPEHHPQGDFHLSRGRVDASSAPRLTFSGAAVYRPELFDELAIGEKARLAPLLTSAMQRDQVAGSRHEGLWLDIGTPQRLEALDRMLGSKGEAIAGEYRQQAEHRKD